MENYVKEELVTQHGIPLILSFNDKITIEEFLIWHNNNREFFSQKLLMTGAILLKGLDIDSSIRLQNLMQKLYPNAKKFLDGNSTRGKYTSNVYNASEYDSDSIIQLHTEFSYSNIWPEIICFCCERKADKGGQTTLGDARLALKLLDAAIVEEFNKKGITYIRNLHSGSGLGPSWQEAFESDNKNFIEDYCKENLIATKWNHDGSLKLIQTRPAIRKHPVTKEDLWFNQVDQFYPQIYGDEIFNTLLAISGDEPENMPMYARYGDGSEIQKEYVIEIINVLDKLTVPVNWEVGDFLLVDNMLSLHGRLAFNGPRKILVSMA